MKDKLVKDWKRVLIISMSFWAQVVGLLVLITPELIYYFTSIDMNPKLLWWSAILLLLFGIIGRLFRQGHYPRYEWLKMSAVIVIIGIVAFLLSVPAYANHCHEEETNESKALDIAVPLIAKWEGKRNLAYPDKIANQPIWTVCYGETLGVNQGDYYTDEQCLSMLKKSVVKHRNGWLVYINDKAKREWLPATRDAAYTSLAYNCGIYAIGKSTATRRLNSGDIKGACQAITWWNRAGKRVRRGLVNRRADEYRLCMMA